MPSLSPGSVLWMHIRRRLRMSGENSDWASSIFLLGLIEQCGFEGAQQRLKECEQLLDQDVFLARVGDSGPRGGEDCWPGGTIVGPFCNFGSQNCCGACNPGIVSYCCPRGKEVCYEPGHRGAMEAYCSHCPDGTCRC